MEYLFKIFVFILVILVARFIITALFRVALVTFIDKKKRNFDTLDEFSKAFCNGKSKNEKRNHLREINNLMFCEKCKEEREVMNPSMDELEHSLINNHIFVEYFKTDKNSWRQLCGREGYIFKCRKHNIQVHEIIICMN